MSTGVVQNANDLKICMSTGVVQNADALKFIGSSTTPMTSELLTCVNVHALNPKRVRVQRPFVISKQIILTMSPHECELLTPPNTNRP